MKNKKGLFSKRVVAFALSALVGVSLFANDITALADGTEVISSVMKNAYSPQSEQVTEKMVGDADELPSSIDLRNYNGYNYVTPVKLQNPFGSCWAFGINGAAEISYLFQNGLGVPAGEVNNNVNFSEKYTNWFAYHPVTAEETINTFPVSQIGEGYDVSRLEQSNVNAVYNLGGRPMSGANLFASGYGPVFEGLEINGWYPYDYHGKNAWRSNDTEESQEAALARKSYYKELFRKGWQYPDIAFDTWFEEMWNNENSQNYENYTGTFSGSEYAGFDDWSIPLTEEYVNSGVAAYFKNSYTLPAPASLTTGAYEYNAAGTAAIKRQIAQGRGVAIIYYGDQSIPGQQPQPGQKVYMNENWAQYCNDINAVANHAVTIVGYDDNYSKDNFTRTSGGAEAESTPPGDGAFIVKNSWGALTNADKASATTNKYGAKVYDNPNANDWGIDDSGYFYLSYYDQSIIAAVSFEFYSDDETKYDYVDFIQYDLLPTSDYNDILNNDETKIANIFETTMDEYLYEISVMTAVPGTTVEYEVYKDVEPGNPTSGTLLETGSSYKEIAGYQRIDLKNEHFLSKGESYSIVVKQTVDGDDGLSYAMPYAIEVNTNKPDVTIKGVINPGESMVYRNGIWTDEADKKDDYINQAFELIKLSSEEWQTLLPHGRDDIAVDNYPIKAFLIPADRYEGSNVAVDVGEAPIKVSPPRTGDTGLAIILKLIEMLL